MANNKIIYNNQTLIDLTGDTVTPAALLKDYIAHNRAGEQIVGTFRQDLCAMELLTCGGGTGATQLSYVNNTEDTLYLVMCLNGSSVQEYRETSSNLSAYSGCTPTSLTLESIGTQTYRLYRLDDCESTVSVTATSYGSSTIAKMMSIYKCGNNLAIDATPSTTPSQLLANNYYKLTANGYLIPSYQSKTPSVSPTSFNSGFVKMSSAGYAIADYSYVEPTEEGSWFRQGFNKMTVSGYGYPRHIVDTAAILPDIKWGGNLAGGKRQSITVTSLPRFIEVTRCLKSTSSTANFYFYNTRYSLKNSTPTYYSQNAYRNSNGYNYTTELAETTPSQSSSSLLYSASSSAVVINNSSDSATYYYIVLIWY